MKGMGSVNRFRTGKLIAGKGYYVKTQGGNWISLLILIEMDREQGCHLQK
jgi:hypothetical protein